MSYLSLLEDFRLMNILFEGIDDMKKYYKNIPDNEFMSYIELDPTYKQGSNKAGTYAKWILGLANSNGGKLDNIGHITDILKRFEDNKKQLKDKDIMKFKSISDLEDYLNDDDNYNDLSHRQEVRLRLKDRRNVDLNNEATLVYEDNDWEVWIPETYAASCKLGQGTSWCTASTETSDYFDDYHNPDYGQYLYININKHNPKEKYQFHFETNSFMDKDDEEINIEEFFVNNPTLYKKVYEDMYLFDIDYVMSLLSTLKENNYTYYYNGLEINSFIRKIIKKLIIEDSVTIIGDYAFYDCYNLTSIEIPNSVTRIGYRAFYNCDSLTSIEIPNSVTSIGSAAFRYCESLTSIVIPDSVESIGSYAFSNCSKLTSVTIGDSVTSMGDGVFYSCSSLEDIKYTGSVKQWKLIQKGKDWAEGVPAKSIKLVDSVGIDESLKKETHTINK